MVRETDAKCAGEFGNVSRSTNGHHRQDKQNSIKSILDEHHDSEWWLETQCLSILITYM